MKPSKQKEYSFSHYPKIVPKTTEEPEKIIREIKEFDFATDPVKEVTRTVLNMLAKHYFDRFHDVLFDEIFNGDAYTNRHFGKLFKTHKSKSHTSLGMSDGFLERKITETKICFVDPEEDLECPEGVSLEHFDLFVTARRVLMRRIQTLIFYGDGIIDQDKVGNLRFPLWKKNLDPYIICSTIAGSNIMNSEDRQVDRNWGGEMISPVYGAGIIEEKFLLFDIAHALNPALTILVKNQAHQSIYFVSEDDGKRRVTVNKRNEDAITISHPMAMIELYHNFIMKPSAITQNKYTVQAPKKPKAAKKNKRKSSNSVSSTVLTAGSRTGTSVNVDDTKTSSPLSEHSSDKHSCDKHSLDYHSANSNSFSGEIPPFKKGKTVKSVGKSDAPVSVHEVSPTREKAQTKQQQCNLEIKRFAAINQELKLGINVEAINTYIRSWRKPSLLRHPIIA